MDSFSKELSPNLLICPLRYGYSSTSRSVIIRNIIVTEFYDGQGLGNQLWLYVVTRCKSKELGINFGIKSPEKFKGFDLFDLDFGEKVFDGFGPEGGPPEVLPNGIRYYFRENLARHPRTGQDITSYSEDWNKIKPSTKIDGNFQGEKYIEKYKEDIRSWLQVVAKPEESVFNDELCIINFRGGEYKSINQVYLPNQYWRDARARMLEINPRMKFKVVTDDIKAAADFFDKSEISQQSMRQDYLDINSAKFLIIANTSFAWFPTWLNNKKVFCIAPKYWWGYNSGEYWACGYNLTRDFHYLDKSARLWSYTECVGEENNHLEIASIDVSPPKIIGSKPKDTKIGYINFATWRINLKKIAPRKAIKQIRLFQSFFKRQKISLLNERIDPLDFFGTPLSDILSTHNGQVYDCFYFFNELDILEIRLEILNEHVDKFVIFESNRTFSGNEKESQFIANRERFTKFESKIIHYWLNDSPVNRNSVTSILHDLNSSRLMKTIAFRTLNSENVPIGPGNDHWTVEAFQKEALHLALIDLKDNDLVFISDVDEIWNPGAKLRFRPNLVYIFKQIPFLYKLNNRSNEHWHNWTGTILATYASVKNSCINELRTHGRLPRIRIRHGGWHFSFQSDAPGIKQKLMAYGHQEINTPENHLLVESYLEKNHDLRGRGAKFKKSDRDLPSVLLKNKAKFSHMFLK